MNQYQHKKTRQAVRNASVEELQEQFNHETPIVREAAKTEFKRRTTIEQMKETQRQI